MRLVIWCVRSAKVNLPEIQDERKIWKWLLVYVWISKQDTELSNSEIEDKLDKIVWKLLNAKFFVNSATNKIELSLKDINWEILLISNFTLYWENKKWTKLDFSQAGEFLKSKEIYEKLVKKLSEKVRLETWEFWAHMIVESVNDGPLNYVIND